jgi:hypothetical protein
MAQKDDPTLDPSLPCANYEAMAPKWGMIDTLLGGTATMREAAEDYLPPHPAEDRKDYNSRLAVATLYNVFELTLDSLVGRVFREELKLNEDVPEEISALEDNIDLQKNSLSGFCETWFREAMSKGFAHCYIDMPALSAEEKANRTLADDHAENRRPFWSLIKPENMIFAFYEKVKGIQTLTHARFIEIETSMVGFAETTQCFIKVLTPGHWEKWRNENEGKANRKPKWVLDSEGDYDLDFIPIITFYAQKKKDDLLVKPPLEDLAFLNIRHWQSNSDQQNVLTVARFPMLASSGAQVEAGKTAQPIGPRQLLTMRDPNGRFYYVEHSGKAISAGKDDLESLEDRMAAYGAEFLRRQVSGRTAFERAQDTNEAISPLKSAALKFATIVQQALQVTGKWLDITEDTGTVTINTKFTQEDESSAPLDFLSNARKRADISRRTFIAEAIRRGAIDQTTDVDAEIAQIKLEAKEGPLPPTYVTATETIRAQENVDPASATDILDGNATAAPVPGADPSAGQPVVKTTPPLKVKGTTGVKTKKTPKK